MQIINQICQILNLEVYLTNNFAHLQLEVITFMQTTSTNLNIDGCAFDRLIQINRSVSVIQKREKTKIRSPSLMLVLENRHNIRVVEHIYF